ncbi:MAG: hypothetical protein HQK60_07345 [Deltaproteobacteria bacterium]|nr:hypothetical protein [Deltaproteobacteria bacterium]
MLFPDQNWIELTEEVIIREDLTAWAARFKLGTAGYRDQLDPLDSQNPQMAFNAIKLAVVAEAKARVYDRLLQGSDTAKDRHVGGEVRPHTQDFIMLVARIYAAHGWTVHLRPDGLTTPIWYSSFGVWYNEFNDGENFTASHSPNFKGGWKPMDGEGKQLLNEAQLIENEVRVISRLGTIVPLAKPDDPNIVVDFDIDSPYIEFLGSLVSTSARAAIIQAGQKGFTCFAATLGGSMGRTSEIIFRDLGIPTGDQGPIKYLFKKEDSAYHGLGLVDGVNHGVDPGKPEIYKHIGADGWLRQASPGSLVFIWDPDGDRFNIVTTASVEEADLARQVGLEVDPLSPDRVLVYFKPNQIYFMLAAFRIAELKANGLIDKYDWIVMETWPTSRSIGELAEKSGLKVIRTPVGFKYFGNALAELENQLWSDPPQVPVRFKDALGRETIIGPHPRVLIMAEESGGAAMGGAEFMTSCHARTKSLAMKEKDGMQVGLVTLALAADLYLKNTSFATYYRRVMDLNDITFRFYERDDIILYDENSSPEKMEALRAEGMRRRDRTVGFFKGLIGRSPDEVHRILTERANGFSIPPIRDIFWAGDGTLIEMENLWWELRASGTDAVLRYYVEGRDIKLIRGVNLALQQLDLD